MIDKNDKYKKSGFLYSSENGNIEIVKMMINDFNIDIN